MVFDDITTRRHHGSAPHEVPSRSDPNAQFRRTGCGRVGAEPHFAFFVTDRVTARTSENLR